MGNFLVLYMKKIKSLPELYKQGICEMERRRGGRRREDRKEGKKEENVI